MVTHVQLPNFASGQALEKASVSADEILLRQEQCRVGSMVVRFSQLKKHIQQRPVSTPWVLELAVNHFDEGRNINKATFPLVLLAAEVDEFHLKSTPEKLPYAPLEREFFLISGQHRVSAMKYLIQQRLERESEGHVHEDDVLEDSEAEWPAIVYSKDFETRSPSLFKIFIDSFNVAPPMLENDPGQLWASASALQASEGSAVAEKYIRAVIPGISNQRAVIKALNNPHLRPAIDRLLQLPIMDFVWSHTCLWTGSHCATLWAGVIQEATHGFSRLTRGDDHLKQKITPASIFRGRSPRLFKKDDFTDLAESLKTSGASLWSEFSPHLLTFKERWNCLVTRDMEYESLLHSKGNQEAVIPWMWSKFLLTSVSSPLHTWVLNMKRLLQTLLLIWCEKPPVLHPTEDLYDILEDHWEDEPFSVDDVIQFCSKHHSDLVVVLDAVWPKSQDDHKKDQLTRVTASPFVTPLAKFETVWEAMSYHVKMNDYWWTLVKLLVAGRFDKGKYCLPSRTIVYEQEPHFFVEEEQEAVKLAQRSIETSKKASETGKLVEKAEMELKKMAESVASLRAQAESKEAEMEKLRREELVARTQGERLKGKALRLLRKTSGPKPDSGFGAPNNSVLGTPPSSFVSTFDLPRREPLDALVPPEFSSLKDGENDWGQEKEIARSLIQLRVLREHVGRERLDVFQSFLERLLHEDILSRVCEGNVDLTSLVPKPELTSLPRPESRKATMIDLTRILEGREELGDTDNEEGIVEDEIGSNEEGSSSEDEAEEDGLENRIKTVSLEPEASTSNAKGRKRKKKVGMKPGPAKRRRQKA